MNRYAIVRDGVIVAILVDRRTLDRVKAEFTDIAALLEAVPAEAQCGWVRAGDTFVPPAPPLAPSVARWKLIAAARELGRKNAIDVAMSSASQRVVDAWNNQADVPLTGIVWRHIVSALALTEAQQRALWTAASEIED